MPTSRRRTTAIRATTGTAPKAASGPGDKKGYDLAIRKLYKAPAEPGGPATFLLYPMNIGPSAVSAATGVQVTDTLPANFQPPITGFGTNWTCSTNGGPPVDRGLRLHRAVRRTRAAAADRDFGRRPRAGQVQQLRRHPAAGGQRPAIRATTAAASTARSPAAGGKKPDIDITKTALKQPWSWPAGTGVYQFRITNVGDTPVPAGHTFTLTENLPAGMVLISTPNAWSCSPGAGTVGAATVTCTYVSTVALNPTAFIQFDMTVGFNGKKEPRYQNCASVAVAGKTGAWRRDQPGQQPRLRTDRGRRRRRLFQHRHRQDRSLGP